MIQTRHGCYEIESVRIVQALRHDDLDPARGACWGLALGAALWVVLLGVAFGALKLFT